MNLSNEAKDFFKKRISNEAKHLVDLPNAKIESMAAAKRITKDWALDHYLYENFKRGDVVNLPDCISPYMNRITVKLELFGKEDMQLDSLGFGFWEVVYNRNPKFVKENSDVSAG